MKAGHLHGAYDILWDDDGKYCCCRVCEQQWFLTEAGWQPRGGVHERQVAVDNAARARRQYYAKRSAGDKKGSLNRGRTR